MNVLKPHLRTTVETLLSRGLSHRLISEQTGVDRRTISKIAAKSTEVATGGAASVVENVPPRPPAPPPTPSACEPHRHWIEAQLKLGRNAMAIYQDLVDHHQFANAYNSVKRFVGRLKNTEPDRYDVLEFNPGEETQVDYGQGAPTRRPGGKGYKRPYLFVMTLRYSRKSFRKCVWKTDQSVWAQLHEEAWRSFGGSCLYVVLDNLKEGVIKSDIYEPTLNPVYAALLRHYKVVADPCRVRDPDRKGTVESAVKHTQSTALKGKKFESIEEQNNFLADWEERWAAPRIHGSVKRQVLEMYEEERPHLQALPTDPFRPFKEGTRTVDGAGFVMVGESHYSALPSRLYSKVKVRIYDRDIEILGPDGAVLRRHEKAKRKGSFVAAEGDRIFNPTRESQKLLERIRKIGPKSAELAERLFAQQGRPAHRLLYGLSNLPKTFEAADIEQVAADELAYWPPSYKRAKRALLQRKAESQRASPSLTQSGEGIPDIAEYSELFDRITSNHAEEPNK